ncbi:MAG: DNA polymerase III subunit delta [Bradyrhizobium sp.]|nr:MAG: DNA polymerase III subunit delta [Bradyrhizobium sp.]
MSRCGESGAAYDRRREGEGAVAIITNATADAYVKRAPRETRFFLVHGSDEGLVRERVKALAATALQGEADPLSLIRFDGDAVARDPGALADEAYAISMFGGARAIWIEAQARDLLPALTPLFARPPEDCVVLVEAGSLKKGTALRAAFEKSDVAASVECYPDDRRSLAPLIEAEARAAGMTIAPEARDSLVALLGADRGATRGELAKLMLYARGKSRIELEDVEAIVTEAAPSSLDATVDATMLSDMAALQSGAQRFFADGGDAGFLVSRLTQRLTLLHRLRLEMERGKPFEAALQTQPARVSPMARVALAKQAERWSAASAARRMPALAAVAGRIRRNPRLGEALAMRALWALASGLKAGRPTQ